MENGTSLLVDQEEISVMGLRRIRSAVWFTAACVAMDYLIPYKDARDRRPDTLITTWLRYLIYRNAGSPGCDYLLRCYLDISHGTATKTRVVMQIPVTCCLRCTNLVCESINEHLSSWGHWKKRRADVTNCIVATEGKHQTFSPKLN